MFGLGLLKEGLSAIVAPVANIFTKREERKKSAETVQGKIALAKVNGENSVTLTDAEWETIAVNKTDSSWKDEFVTIVIMFPIIGIMAGAVWLAFSGDGRLLAGVKDGIAELNTLGMDYATLTEAVVFAALGLKLWRRR